VNDLKRPSRARSIRAIRTPGLDLAIADLMAVLPGVASAARHCVGAIRCGNHVDSLDKAFDAAAQADDADRIFVGARTHVANTVGGLSDYHASAPVEIIGQRRCTTSPAGPLAQPWSRS
jgi:hypothetical protein